MAPLLLLYIGEIGIAKDPAAAFAQMGVAIWPVLAQSTLSALAMSGDWRGAGRRLRRAEHTRRRRFSASFLLLAAISPVAATIWPACRAHRPSCSIRMRALRTMALLLFGETTRGMELEPPPPMGVYVALDAGHRRGRAGAAGVAHAAGSRMSGTLRAPHGDAHAAGVRPRVALVWRCRGRQRHLVHRRRRASPDCWAPTAPARARCCSWRPACWRRRTGRCACTASRRWTGPRCIGRWRWCPSAKRCRA